MNGNAILLYRNELTSSDLNITKIIDFMGGSVCPVDVAEKGFTCEEFVSKNNACIIVSADTLAKSSASIGMGSGLPNAIINAGAKALVYGFQPMQPHNRLLQELTSGSLIGVQELQGGSYNFDIAKDSREVCGQLTGLSVQVARSRGRVVFVEGKTTGCPPLIRVEDYPFFVTMKDEGNELFLLASQDIADLEAKVAPQTTLMQWFPELVPLMMFMRSALPHQLWHNDSPTACFIVDDPLLKRHYGFLEYHKLFDVMEQKDFSTSIAFIPWNYRRSSKAVVDLFAMHSKRASLCIHGCDHTRNEFGGRSSLYLKGQAQKALDRMALHHRLSGLAFDDIMVFPQGLFSSVAVAALKSCGFLAAVNSTMHSSDRGDEITLLDLVDVAMTRFSNFPVFIRRYPSSDVELALDLFLGKPALVVEHHGFFHNGYDALAECVDKIRSFEARVEWTSLGKICSKVCLKRVSKDGGIHVKFFGDRFVMHNDSSLPRRYVMFRRQLSEDPVVDITVDNMKADFVQDGNYARFSLLLNAGQSVEIKVQFATRDEELVHPDMSLLYNTKVLARRYLSELRDNYIDRSEFLSKTVVKCRNLLTGD